MTVSPDTQNRTASLDELRALYQAQLSRLTSERDEARREARRAKAAADTARADLASLAGKVQDLMRVARVQEDQRSM